MKVVEVSGLANDRGCRLNIVMTDNTPIYWVENAHFISKPFRKLDELALLLYQMPVLLTHEDVFDLAS